jgi:hypothetical protein
MHLLTRGHKSSAARQDHALVPTPVIPQVCGLPTHSCYNYAAHVWIWRKKNKPRTSWEFAEEEGRAETGGGRSEHVDTLGRREEERAAAQVLTVLAFSAR